MNGAENASSTSPPFEWQPEYEEVLEKAASSDYAEQDWTKLRDIIIHRLNENVASFISNPTPPAPRPIPQERPIPPPSTSETTDSGPANGPPPGNVKFPPFPIRDVGPIVRTEYNSYGRERTLLDEDQANDLKDNICKLLRDFNYYPPFTVQRLCELVHQPRRHYKTASKYLRAIERSILVTSDIDAFPIIPPSDRTTTAGLAFSPASSLRDATTPLFSPIPFLHEDARRSRSKSPPVSPLMLATQRPHSPEPIGQGATGSSDGPVIGLVDELDDPAPGHMSDRPHAITSTTSTPAESPALGTTSSAQVQARPLFGGSLTERFVKASNGGESGKASSESDDGMSMDEGEADKENVPK